MNRRHVTLACAPYDRTLPLFDGRVSAEGLELNVVLLRYEDTFWRMLRHREFEVSEMSLSSYLLSKDQDDPFIAIPVFLSRVFRHSSIYVNAKAGIRVPADLKGKRIGVPEYQMTAALWIRGILQHEYGVHPRDMQWWNGGLDEPGRIEKLALNLPADVHLASIPATETLNDWLLEGKLDALATARPPSSFRKRDPRVRQLFDDPKAVEIDYWKKTGIYPPMHCVAIRRDVYERDRWIAQSLYKAFDAARRLCTLEDMWDGHLRYAHPLLHHSVEEALAVFGGSDPWRYGVPGNRHTLDTLAQYSHEQGLTRRRYAIEELFAAETLDVSRN